MSADGGARSADKTGARDAARAGGTEGRGAVRAEETEGRGAVRAEETEGRGAVRAEETEGRGAVRAGGTEGRGVVGADGSGTRGADGPGTRGAVDADGTGTRGAVSAGEGEARSAVGPDEVEVRDAISAPDAEGRPRRATRRFPLFTRDTARPEGGGRAAPGDAPAPARQWPILVVLGLVGTGLLITALDAFRPGTLLIGAALLGGAVLRWLLPDVGMLAVRSRFTDIVTYGVLGAAIVLLAMMAQPKPWLEIPFLKDTLHFTVSG